MGPQSATGGTPASASASLIGSFLLLLLTSPFAARAESWTNQAGKAIQAEALSLERGVVTLKTSDGKNMRVPLTAFNLASQQRLRTRFKIPTVPDHILHAHRDAMAMLQRYDRLPADRKTEEGRIAVLRAARTLFDSRVASGTHKAPPAALRQDIERLRLTIR